MMREPAMTTAIDSAPARLLIVDDDVSNVRIMAEILRDMGEAFFATDGVTAVRVAGEKRPDVILLDAEMPGMSGYQVCESLKADPATAACVVIFVTAHKDIAHEAKALALGGADVIHKPVSPPLVRARVWTHLILKRQAEQLSRLGVACVLHPPPND